MLKAESINIELLEEKSDEQACRPSKSSDNGCADLICVVCGDIATGRHYGTIACNGCKGFFRRSIRRGYKYNCRFNNTCNIDKHNRAICRACRYMRCINAGMKITAVQNERDIIGKRTRLSSAPTASTSTATIGNASDPLNDERSKDFGNQRFQQQPQQQQQQEPNDCGFSRHCTSNFSWDTPRSLLESLLVSEKKIQSLRDTVIKQAGAAESICMTDQKPEELQNSTDHGRRTATVNDIYLSIHSQLLLVIEWAKTLPPFAALSTDDQTALLKNFASQHVVLCVSYRSKDNSDFLKLLNDSCIPRCHRTDGELLENIYLRDCERVMDQLVAPMRYLKMDDVEFVALKACVLFNPVAKGLSSGSVMQILATRRQIFGALEHYISTKIPADSNRIGDLTFFVLSPLQALANAVSEDVLVYKLSGVARIDQLMEELILAETEEHKVPNRLSNELSLRELYTSVLKTPRNSSPPSMKKDSNLLTQHAGNTPVASPDEIMDGFEERQSINSFENNSPITTVLSSFMNDPFKSHSQSPVEFLSPMTNVPNQQSRWTTTVSQGIGYLDNDATTYATSTINL